MRLIGRESIPLSSSATTILYLPQGATALTTSAGRMAAVQVVSLNRDAGDSHGTAGAWGQ